MGDAVEAMNLEISQLVKAGVFDLTAVMEYDDAIKKWPNALLVGFRMLLVRKNVLCSQENHSSGNLYLFK